MNGSRRIKDIRAVALGFISVLIVFGGVIEYKKLLGGAKEEPTERKLLVAPGSSNTDGEMPSAHSKWDTAYDPNQSSFSRSIRMSGMVAAKDLSALDIDSIADYLQRFNTKEEQSAWWTSIVATIAVTDIDKAVELAQLAPQGVQAEKAIVDSIVAKQGSDGFMELAKSSISGAALAAGFGLLPVDNLDSVLGELVELRGKLGSAELRAIQTSRRFDRPQDADLLVKMFDPAHWGTRSQKDMEWIVSFFKQSGMNGRAIREKLEEYSEGNTVMVGQTLAKQRVSIARHAGLSGESEEADKRFIEARAAAESRDQAAKMLEYYAFGKSRTAGGVSALGWASSLEDADDRKVSVEVILRGFVSDSPGRSSFYADLEREVAENPQSKVLPTVKNWLGQLSEHDEQRYHDFVSGLPETVRARLEVGG